MTKKIWIVNILIICILFTVSSEASADKRSCSNYLNSLGIPKDPKTVMDFEYLSVAIGEIKEKYPDCIPNTSKSSSIDFESLFSEKVIDNVIATYPSYQVVQMALVDLETAISGISSWYVTDNSQYAIERAKLYLLQLYVVVRSLELYGQNMQNTYDEQVQPDAIKDFVFNEIKIVEAYITYNNFFGVLNKNQHLYVKSKMVEYLMRLKDNPIFLNDNEFRNKLDTISDQLKTKS